MASSRKSARARKSKSLQTGGRSMPIISTALSSLVNMTVTAVTSGCACSQLSDFCDERFAMIMNYLPLISATVVVLVILAFAAEARSQ